MIVQCIQQWATHSSVNFEIEYLCFSLQMTNIGPTWSDRPAEQRSAEAQSTERNFLISFEDLQYCLYRSNETRPVPLEQLRQAAAGAQSIQENIFCKLPECKGRLIISLRQICGVRLFEAQLVVLHSLTYSSWVKAQISRWGISPILQDWCYRASKNRAYMVFAVTALLYCTNGDGNVLDWWILH